MQNITVNLNLDRGSCRILKPLYLGATVDISFDTEGSYSLVLTEPFTDSPSNGIAVWAQSSEGKLALTRKALHDAFKKAHALQPNMTIVAKMFVQNESGATVADGEVVIEYSPAAYVMDAADYPTAEEVLTRAMNAAETAGAYKDAAERARSAAETSVEAAERAARSAASSVEAADLAKSAAGREADSASTEANRAAKEAADAKEAATEAKNTLAAGSEVIKAEVEVETKRATAAEEKNAAAIDETGRALVAETERAKTAEQNLANEVSEVGDKVDTLVAGDAKKSARTIAAEEVAKVVANAPADLDTLKEIAAYIESDKTNAAQMVANIDSNTKSISAEVKRAQEAETALAGRVKELENAPSVEVDDTLTRDGSNPVKSSGIWSAIWGAISAPAASVYEWMVNRLSQKVDKENGKALSTNDYTNEDKNKLNGIEAGAQKNPDLTPYAKATDVDAIRRSVNENAQVIANKAEKRELRYALVEKVGDSITLDDRACNYVNATAITDYIAVTFPPYVADKGRDFKMILECSSDTTISYESAITLEGEDGVDLAPEEGVNVYFFTEFATGRFTVARKLITKLVDNIPATATQLLWAMSKRGFDTTAGNFADVMTALGLTDTSTITNAVNAVVKG